MGRKQATSLVEIGNFVYRKALRAINRVMDSIEKHFAPKSDLFRFGPTFIIGAPRSGSTLLYQTLVNAFGFGYLTNLHCQFYGFPYLLQSMAGRWLPVAESPYESVHGETKGLMSPSECGEFWYRWFRRHPQYVPLEDADLLQLGSLRRVLVGLTEALGSPLLIKNMPCALRLRPLAALLPEARFLFIRRDPLWTAQSLLLARERMYGNQHTWWSMEPPEIDSLRDLSPEEQVVRQIHGIYRLIQNDSQAIGPERFCEVRFESFCQDVPGTLEQIRLFLSEGGIDPSPRLPVPESFSISYDVRLPSDQFSRLGALVKEIRPDDCSI